ncbi:MAG: CHAD domain-containing protein, partial [Pseudarthrobacter sp.]|nr:CHAD domain-containing protein [Pseudarthrobacter sp.]
QPDDGGRQQWREGELELVHGEPGLFEPVEELLLAAGARPAGHASKLARALGGKAAKKRAAESPADAGPDGSRPLRAGKRAPAAAVVTVYVAEQLDQLLASDPGARLEDAEAVHDMRSAARRIRSALAAYAKLYRASPVRRLRDELQWLGRVLGQPRDAHVLREDLRGQLGQLPAGEGAAAATERVERRTTEDFDAAYRLLQDALGSDRYFRLLDKLEDFRDNPPVRAEAVSSGQRASAKAVDKAAKRLRRSQKAARDARRGTDQERALHQVRKNAKRLRHIAESAALVRGKRAGKVAKAAHRQQKILGRFQDAVVARTLLADIAAEHTEPATATVYAGLLDRQEERMLTARAKYRKARKKSRALLRSGVL